MTIIEIEKSLEKNKWNLFFLFLLLGFLLYGNTLNHEYTLDDALVITDNEFTKKGIDGIWDQLTNDQFVGFYGQKKDLVSGGRYRPLSMVVFNLQISLAGLNPQLGHFINVLWYILCGFLLFLVLRKLFNESGSLFLSLSFISTLLWFFHPIHTEVVANIKGLDEMMAFSGELTVMLLLLSYLENKKIAIVILAAFAYFLSLLSKENAITWLAIYPLALIIFRPGEIKKAIPFFTGLLLSAFIWIYIRYTVVGGGIESVADNLMNDPFLNASLAEKYATITLTLGKYLQLLFFPHPLTFDYYPKHIPIVNWSNPLVLSSLISYLVLIFFAVKGIIQKRTYGFAIALFFITLSIASNLLFPIGAFMNERFVFVSSLGFTIIIAGLIKNGIPKLFVSKASVPLTLILVLCLYSIKTISRNPDWKNNYSLATHDALISINGAKSNVMAGGIILEEKVPNANTESEKKELLQRSIFHLNRAIQIYPEYIDALLLMGNAQWEYQKNADAAMPYYMNILNINPNNNNAWTNCLIVLSQEKNSDKKIAYFQQLLQFNPYKTELYVLLGRAYGQEKGDLNSAKKYLLQGAEIAPNNYDIWRNLGTVYGLQQEYQLALESLQKAIKIKNNIAQDYIDLAVSLYHLGMETEAKNYMDQAIKINPKINRENYPI